MTFSSETPNIDHLTRQPTGAGPAPVSPATPASNESEDLGDSAAADLLLVQTKADADAPVAVTETEVEEVAESARTAAEIESAATDEDFSSSVDDDPWAAIDADEATTAGDLEIPAEFLPDETDLEPASSVKLPSARQTQTYLRELLDANGLRPRRQLGQNFLIDLNLLELIIRAARVQPDDVVLEVGAGTGGVTTRLARQVSHVIAVEIDPGFHRLVEREIEPFDNVTLLHTDVLKNKNTLQPLVVDTIRDVLQKRQRSHFHLVANLPYDVASSVIGNLLVGDLPVRSLTMTIQFEVGLRIISRPQRKDYGPLGITAQMLGKVYWIRSLPPSAFWPRPKVRSAILKIEVDEAKKAAMPDLQEWNRFLRDLFMHRRKMLRAAIASVPGYKALKPKLDRLLSQLGLDADLRAEQLTPEQLYVMFQLLQNYKEPTAE